MKLNVLKYYEESLTLDSYLKLKFSDKNIISKNEYDLNLPILAVNGNKENSNSKLEFENHYKRLLLKYKKEENTTDKETAIRKDVSLYYTPFLISKKGINEYYPIFSIEINSLNNWQIEYGGNLVINYNIYTQLDLIQKEEIDDFHYKIEKEYGLSKIKDSILKIYKPYEKHIEYEYGLPNKVNSKEELQIYIKEFFKLLNIELNGFDLNEMEKEFLIKYPDLKIKLKNVFYLIDNNEVLNADMITVNLRNLYKQVLATKTNKLLDIFLSKNDNKTFPAPIKYEFDNYSSIEIDNIKEKINITKQMGTFDKNNSLTDSQKYALSCLETNSPILAVNGPPGTGKTALLRAVIANYTIENALTSYNYLKKNKRVEMMPPIASFSTNGKALDNIIEGITDAYKEILSHKDNSERNNILYKKWLNPNFRVEEKDFEALENKENPLYVPFLKSKEKIREGKTTIFELPLLNLTRIFASIHQEKEKFLNEYIKNGEKLFILKSKNNYDKLLEIVDILYLNLEKYKEEILIKEEIVDNLINPYSFKFLKKTKINKSIVGIKKLLKIKNKIHEEKIEEFLKELVKDDKSRKLNNYFYAIRLLEGLFLIDVFNNKDNVLSSKLICPICEKNEFKSSSNKNLLICKCGAKCLRNGITNSELQQIFKIGYIFKDNSKLKLDFNINGDNKWINFKKSNEADGKDIKMLSAFFPILNTTCHGFAGQYKIDNKVPEDFFELMLVDEAGMILPSLMINLYAGKRVIFFGDTKQIEPIYPYDGNKEIDRKLFFHHIDGDDITYENYSLLIQNAMSMANQSIYIKNDNPKYKTNLEGDIWLKEHFRCNDNIIGFCNELVYDGIINPMKGNIEKDNNILISYNEDNLIKNESQVEIDIILNEIQELMKNGLKESDIGIITPFSKQEKLLIKELSKRNLNITAGTVHKFQGSERTVIFFSTTIGKNGTDAHNMFFNRDNGNMLNVAISRAKKTFITIGNIQKLEEDLDTHSYKLVDYIKRNGIIKYKH